MRIKHQAKWFLALTLLPVLAQASTSSVGFQAIYSSFQTVTQGWYSALFEDALGLFAALFTIEFVWMVTKWLITGKDVHEIFTSFIKKMLSIGFFFSILVYSNQLFPDLINAFKSAASGAGGPPVTTVSAITMTALRAFMVCVEAGPVSAAKGVGTAASDLWNLNLSGAASAMSNAASAAITSALGVNTIVGILVGLILLISFIYLVLELFAVQLEAMLVMGTGVLMLGFGGSSFTAKFTEAYMQYSLSVGVRLMILTLWAGFVEWKVAPLIKTILTQGGAGLEAYGMVLILALLVGWLTKKLQGIAASILSGSSSMSGGELAGGIMRGVALATAAVATGGVAAAGLAGGAAAGGLSGATGAAGAAGAGDLGAATGGSAMSAPNIGANAGSAAHNQPAPQTTSGVATPAMATSGVLPPSQATSGTSQKSGVNPPEANNAAPKAGTAPDTQGGTTSQGAPANALKTISGEATPGVASENRVGVTAPKTGSGVSGDGVDHRPYTSNDAPQSAGASKDRSAPAPRVDAAPAPQGNAGSAPTPQGNAGSAPELKGAGGGQSAPDSPSFMERAKQHEKAINSAHDALMPGEPTKGGVSAPPIGAKHLSD